MPFDPQQHYQNRSQFPTQQLAQYYGKEVAWSLDGTQILASGEDPAAVGAAVLKAGFRSDDVVLAYVPFPDEVMLGGVSLLEEEGA